jgi:hypothetical protein
MSYTPFNNNVFFAAYTGAQSGMLGSANTSPNGNTSLVGQVCAAWAQAVDSSWQNPAPLSSYEFSSIEELSKTYWLNRQQPAVAQPPGRFGGFPSGLLASTYSADAHYITGVVLAGEVTLNNFLAPGITPPAQPGGGLLNLSWFAGLSLVNTIGWVNVTPGVISITPPALTTPSASGYPITWGICDAVKGGLFGADKYVSIPNAGGNIEDPVALNTYTTNPIVLKLPGERVVWQADPGASFYKITSLTTG